MLEFVEGGDAAFRRADEQFAIEGCVEVGRFEQVREGFRDVVAIAGVEAADALVSDELDTDAIPLPFGGEVCGGDAAGVDLFGGHALGLVEQRVRQHRRAEGGEGGGDGFRRAAFEPGEEVCVRRGEAVPEFFDLADIDLAEIGEGLPGEPGGHADAQAAGDQLQERPATGGV